MAYVTMNEHTALFVGSVSIPPDEFSALAERASDVIDELTQYRVDMKVLNVFQQKQVKKAVCAQIEHMYYHGIETVISGGSSESYNIGNTSITRSVGNQSTSTTPRISPLAIRLLAPTGLLYRGGVSC